VGRVRAAGVGKDGALVGANPADLMIEALFAGSKRGRRKGGGSKGGEGPVTAALSEVVVQEEKEEEEEEEEEEAKAEPEPSPPAMPTVSDGRTVASGANIISGGGGSSKAAAAGVSLWVQTAVLSQRMLRDHMRRPWLLACHVLANVYLGGACVFCCWWCDAVLFVCVGRFGFEVLVGKGGGARWRSLTLESPTRNVQTNNNDTHTHSAPGLHVPRGGGERERDRGDPGPDGAHDDDPALLGLHLRLGPPALLARAAPLRLRGAPASA
jgi:hypothetical protein